MSAQSADNVQLRIGMVFSFTNDRINNGVKLNNNLIEVGYINKVVGENESTDPTRVNSHFVVEHVKITTNKPKHSASYENEEYPRIYARRLNEDDSYNPTGELIVFYNKYGFDSFLSGYLTRLHKVMRRIVTFVDSVEGEDLLLANIIE